MRSSRRFTLMMAIIALILYSARTARCDEPVVEQDEPMLIIPAAKFAPVDSDPPLIVFEGVAPVPRVDAAEYRRIYRSIPFSRAEYAVNPGYRHDSTMEILTGHARHQTIVQQNHEHKDKEPVKPQPVPARPSRMLMPFVLPYGGFGSFFGGPFMSPWGGFGW